MPGYVKVDGAALKRCFPKGLVSCGATRPGRPGCAQYPHGHQQRLRAMCVNGAARSVMEKWRGAFWLTGLLCSTGAGRVLGAAMPGVEWVVGNSHKTQIAELVTSLDYHGQIHGSAISSRSTISSFRAGQCRGSHRHVRIWKIQVGHNRCSFASFRYVWAGAAAHRWHKCEQMRHPAVRYREVVLSGINLGR